MVLLPFAITNFLVVIGAMCWQKTCIAYFLIGLLLFGDISSESEEHANVDKQSAKSHDSNRVINVSTYLVYADF